MLTNLQYAVKFSKAYNLEFIHKKKSLNVIKCKKLTKYGVEKQARTRNITKVVKMFKYTKKRR